MQLRRSGAVALVLVVVATSGLSACSQQDVPSCGEVTQTSTQAADIANARFPLYPVHIEPAPGVRPVSIYDVNRKDNLGYPVGEMALDTFMPEGTYVLHGFVGDEKCQTAFEVM